MSESGTISIHAENILPIIKKWLYSEKEIFIRELVANSVDAMHKLQKMHTLGELDGELGEFAVKVSCDRENKTLTISDNGVGMTADEVKRYINQVAFSGVKDFVEKYQDKDANQQVIGHFGLGFYSSFMVAKRVEIDTLSYREGAEAVRWSCDGSVDFTLSPSSTSERGTRVILHIADDCEEMLDENYLRHLLLKYCAFVKYPLFIKGEQVNNTDPLWNKSPSALGDKDYLDFFHGMFPHSPDPMFWIHLNVDYPFVMKGILFFPRIFQEMDTINKGEVKLYCNQMYVATNLDGLIPEYLTLLQGGVDCADLPLNVSRSYLQNDPQVRKISQHISKKVADRIVGMAKTERDKLNNIWKDLGSFVKFAMMHDNEFCDRLMPHILFRTTTDNYLTFDEYLAKNSEHTDGKIIYVSDVNAQISYVELLEEQGIDVVINDAMIDGNFIGTVEDRSNGKYSFRRVDASFSENLLADKKNTIIDPTDNKDETEKVADLFRDFLDKQRVRIRVENFKSERVPAMLIFDEGTRRRKEMQHYRRYGVNAALFGNNMSDEHQLIVNSNNSVIKSLLKLSVAGKKEDVKLLVNQVYDLAYLQHGRLTSTMMKSFIERSSSIMERMGSQGSGLIV